MTDANHAYPWVVWTYALNPGWENSGSYPSREDAREVRDELITVDGFPPEWVRVRHRDDVGGMRRPSKRSISAVELAIAKK